MSEESIKTYLTFIEKVLRNDKNVTIEINRSEPNVIYENGIPESVPTWIKQTVTVSSEWYYNPDLAEEANEKAKETVKKIETVQRIMMYSANETKK